MRQASELPNPIAHNCPLTTTTPHFPPPEPTKTPLPTNMFRLIIVACLLLWSATQSAAAQPQQEVYTQTIDQINCATVKTLLVSYDRPVAARMIQPCNYDNILRAIDKVQENTIKGYKKMILETAQSINSYKSKVTNPAEYSLYESALEEVQALALRRYEEVCSKNKGANATVCTNMEQKSLKLQSEINSLVQDALPKISQQTYGGGKPAQKSESSKSKPTAKDPTATEDVPRGEYNNGTQPETAESEGNSGASRLWVSLQALILLGLIAAVIWLFKENRELKEKMDDIAMLLKMLNQKK